MKVHEIMTAHARCAGPDNSLVEAAGLMRELDVGSLPVCEDDRLSGIVTDRDMVLRGIAEGRDPNTALVRDVMTPGVVVAYADQEVEEVARLMEERQIRRVPVLNRQKRLVGIVSLGDIAISSNPAFSGMALRDVSEPTHPTARQRKLTQLSEPTRMPVGPGGTSEPAGTSRRTPAKAKARAGASKSLASADSARRKKRTTRAAVGKGSPTRAKPKGTPTTGGRRSTPRVKS